jgi:CheY-like chemotaxis protein
LGLAIVKQLVEYHGGTVAAKSPGDGRGSTFIVRLPITITQHGELPERHPAAVTPVTLDLSLTGLRILVVDDDNDACLVLERLLQTEGAAVHCVLSASEAVPLLERETFDMLISDIGMPEQDGFEFIVSVRRMPDPIGSIPAIAVTAFARPEDRIAALQAGYNMHIAKPLDARELLTVIARLKQRKPGG